MKLMWQKSATRFGKVLPDLSKNRQKVLPDWAKSGQNDKKSAKWQIVAKVAKSPQIRLQGVSRGLRWFQVSNSMGSDDSGYLRAGTLRVRGTRSGPEGP